MGIPPPHKPENSDLHVTRQCAGDSLRNPHPSSSWQPQTAREPPVVPITTTQTVYKRVVLKGRKKQQQNTHTQPSPVEPLANELVDSTSRPSPFLPTQIVPAIRQKPSFFLCFGRPASASASNFILQFILRLSDDRFFVNILSVKFSVYTFFIFARGLFRTFSPRLGEVGYMYIVYCALH